MLFGQCFCSPSQSMVSQISTLYTLNLILIHALKIVVFTVANLIITDSFPIHTQALAGAVFNTMAQFGTSTGIAIMAIISSSVSQADRLPSDQISGDIMMKGYRAVFWACFALMLLTALVGIFGLRGIKQIGRQKH